LRAGETPLRRRSEGQPEEEAEGADRSLGEGGGEFSGEGTGDLERGERERKKREVCARFRVAGWDVALWAELVAAAAGESVELLVDDDDGGVQLAEEDESESETWRRWLGRFRVLGKVRQGGCMMVLARCRIVCGTGPGRVVEDAPPPWSKDETPTLVVGDEDVLDSCEAVRFHLKPEVKIWRPFGLPPFAAAGPAPLRFVE
jgi:hypothetical protein